MPIDPDTLSPEALRRWQEVEEALSHRVAHGRTLELLEGEIDRLTKQVEAERASAWANFDRARTLETRIVNATTLLRLGATASHIFDALTAPQVGAYTPPLG